MRGTHTGSARRSENVTKRTGGKMQVAGITIERDSISRVEIGTRFVADYELKIFAKILNVDVVWLLADKE